MKIVIEIPDRSYDLICQSDITALADHVSKEELMYVIKNGVKVPEDIGEFSDGYHTFNQLYHQRAVLFATIVNQNPDISWKSFKHSDGEYCFSKNGDWFIVGIDTPEGSYTYHYSKEYWDMFKCPELECGKEWDGHTEKDVTRLLSLNTDNLIDGKELIDLFEKLIEMVKSYQCIGIVDYLLNKDKDYSNE